MTCFLSGIASARIIFPVRIRTSLMLVELFSEQVPETFRKRGTGTETNLEIILTSL